MPTFNQNKDSLAADVNGTYAGPDGSTEFPNEDRYQDYTAYLPGSSVTGTVILDADTNDSDEVGTDFKNPDSYILAGNIVTVENVEHTAKETANAVLIGMDAWLALAGNGYDPAEHGNYWVFDTDGWVYWSSAIQPGTATGLLLDGIELARSMGDSWYYAIEVTAQFVTVDDIGKADGTGFYDEEAGSIPTAEAEKLLQIITDQPSPAGGA